MSGKPIHNPIAQFDEGELVICNTIESDIVFLIEELTQEVLDTADCDNLYSHWLIKHVEVTSIRYDSGGHCIEFRNREDRAHIFKLCLRNTSLPFLDYDSFHIVRANRRDVSTSSSWSFCSKEPDKLVCLRHLIHRHYEKSIKLKAPAM